MVYPAIQDEDVERIGKTLATFKELLEARYFCVTTSECKWWEGCFAWGRVGRRSIKEAPGSEGGLHQGENGKRTWILATSK